MTTYDKILKNNIGGKMQVFYKNGECFFGTLKEKNNRFYINFCSLCKIKIREIKIRKEIF